MKLRCTRLLESRLATRRHTISGPDEILVLIASTSSKSAECTILTEPSPLTYTKYGSKVRFRLNLIFLAHLETSVWAF